MAGSQEDSILDLLRPTILDQADLRYIAAQLDFHKVSVPALLMFSEDRLERLIVKLCPDASEGAKCGVEAAVLLRKESSTHEGARPSKKAKFLSSEERISARSSYFGKLLEPPAELPVSVNQLKEFLSLTPVKLPVLYELTNENLGQPNLVVLDTSEGASQLATFCETVFQLMKHSLPDNEATSSTELCILTGYFLRLLNDIAPESKQLLSLQFRQDSANRTTASAASQPLEPLLRPDFQLFVKYCLILRWENKINDTLLAEAVDENRSKLKAWSPLFYEGARLAKKAKPSPEVLSFARAAADAGERYFGKLLEPPPTLPRSTHELSEFLSQTPVPLPTRNLGIFQKIRTSELVELETPAAAENLASFCDTVFGQMMRRCPSNEATSSHELANLTGEFISLLNEEAPANGKLKGLVWLLDSPNPPTSTVASGPLKPLLRPDFQLFVRGCLILRWENTIDAALRNEAVLENTSKLKAWSPLFYGKLPYVIGGGCGGRQFEWLKLYPRGKEIVCESISQLYDLNVLTDVAKFLHSTIRMHCLLQKLQKELGSENLLSLYKPIARDDGGAVTIYPDFVTKEIPRLMKDKVTAIKCLYAKIEGSRYLIQLISARPSRAKTVLRLQPVGDPSAKPKDCKDLVNATHDMLCGLADLHMKGYTHRDIRWPNVIKVNDMGEWKWVIIDLEAAGDDNEVWVGEDLTGWDAETLEEDNDKRKRYTKGSDMYQLGKLIAEWLDDFSMGGKEERQLMRSRAKQMQQERTAAAKMLEDICKKRCERCRVFGTKL